MFGPSLGARNRDRDGSQRIDRRRSPRRRSRERLDHLPVAAASSRRGPPGCCTLCVASNTTGAEQLHDRQAGEIVDESSVAEERPRSVSSYVAQPAARQLLHHMLHVARGHELPFFTFTAAPRLRPPRAAGRSVAQERGDLQQLAHLGRRGVVLRLVDVGRDGHADFASDAVENLQPRFQPQPAERAPDVRLACSNEAPNTEIDLASSAASARAVDPQGEVLPFRVRTGPAMQQQPAAGAPAVAADARPRDRWEPRRNFDPRAKRNCAPQRRKHRALRPLGEPQLASTPSG